MFVKDTKTTIVNEVRQARTSMKMTQDDLARHVSATRQTIIAIEKGNYVPSVLLTLKIAESLNKKVEELFAYEEK